jgi:glutamate/tyrosine decarboxylase-like PLP-dependent enzyme
VAARLHEVVSVWLAELLGLPAGTAAVFVSGASLANTTALAAARDHQLARAGWDVQADGLFGAPELTVVIGEYAHSTVVRALGLLGLGRNRVRRVPADDQGRMRADRLPEDVTGPVVICAQAGEVNTGAFDPFPAIGEWARRHQAWMHVDGAFGLWALTDPSRSHLTAGLAEADSWATDGHKWLNVPYDCGIAFTAHPESHSGSFSARAAYLTADDSQREQIDWNPEHSRRARGFTVYAAIRSLGRAGIADLVERCCRHARRFAAGLEDLGAEVLNDVELNQVLFRFASDAETDEALRGVQASGEAWMSGTTWDGRAAIRISVSNWQTSDEDVERTLAAFAEARSQTGSCEAIADPSVT